MFQPASEPEPTDGGNYITLIDDGVFLGSQRTLIDPSLILQNGITAVVSLGDDRGDVDMAWPDDDDLSTVEQLCVPCADDDTENLLPSLYHVVRFIKEHLRAGGKVLVHGGRCVCRAPTFLAAYLMKKTGCSVRPAVKRISSRRGGIEVRQEFLAQLYLWRHMSYWIWKDAEQTVPKSPYRRFRLERWKEKRDAASRAVTKEKRMRTKRQQMLERRNNTYLEWLSDKWLKGNWEEEDARGEARPRNVEDMTCLLFQQGRFVPDPPRQS